jgi:hypothetical protein
MALIGPERTSALVRQKMRFAVKNCRPTFNSLCFDDWADTLIIDNMEGCLKAFADYWLVHAAVVRGG